MSNYGLCRDIVIVGGGSAGWLLACRLAKSLAPKEGDFTITLVESPDVKTVGVGEGTWPTMRATLKSIGIPETEFIRRASASLKQGTRFNGWRTGDPQEYYYHPFEPPIGRGRHNVGEIWRTGALANGGTFASAVSPQEAACLGGLAPKTYSTPEYKCVLNYGYHLDAGAFGELLAEYGTEHLGVRHVKDDVIAVNKDDHGWIESLRLKSGDALEGDLFFDCTGFRSYLLHEQLDVPFVALDKSLFVDSALVAQCRYGNSSDPIVSATVSTAHEAGWIWDIGLCRRRGVGFVYSSHHMKEGRAATLLNEYLGIEGEAEFRKISFKAQRLQRMWEKNAVAAGLSAGFVEPLEASALMLIETVADWFCDRFPKTRDSMQLHSTKFNEILCGYWERIVDFLKFHYVLSERPEAFWMDNRDPVSMPMSLRENMATWRDDVPFAHDFRTDSKIFSWESYQYVYLGMRPENGRAPYATPPSDLSQDFELNRRICAKVGSSLPTNRALLDQLSTGAFPVR